MRACNTSRNMVTVRSLYPLSACYRLVPCIALHPSSTPMSSEASCQDVLLGTPTRSSTSSSDAEAAVSFESESSKQGSSEACPSESALTPMVVANPAQLVPAAETPSGEELSLTLQAYPHLRNTRVAKGWRPPPVISATPVL